MPFRELRVARTSLARCLTAFLVTLLAACGGGGGGSSNGLLPSTGTGFIPAPGALGATLYARGTDVRPVRAGAKWVYHRNDFAFGGDLDYTNTSVAGSGGQVLETTSDDPTHPTTVTVDVDGSVRISAPVSLDGTTVFTVSGFELRSPVRVNDQYVLYDGNVPNIDADGDGKSDLVEFAFWRVVVGNESVDLPNRPAATSALRVDSFVVVKVTPSAGAAAVQVSSSTSAWYEPGVGIVRQTIASSSPSRALDADDVLTGWDGVTEGRGYITQPQQFFGPSVTAVRSATSAVGLPNGALVLAASGWHRLDRNGVVQATLPDPPIASPAIRLFRSSAGVRSLSGFWPAMQLHAFDDQGQYLAPAGAFDFSNERPNTIFEGNWTFSAHPGSPWLWVAWQRTVFAPSDPNPTVEIVLRAVAGDGTSTLPERSFAVTDFLQSSSIRLSALPDATLLTWNEFDSSSVMTARAVRVSNAGALSFDTRPVVVTEVFPGTTGIMIPVSDAATTWLAWFGTAATPVPGMNAATAFGVRLDAMGQAVGAPASAALPAAVDPLFIDWPAGLVADAGHLFATGTGFGLAFPNDHQSTILMTYADFAAGTGPLASSIARSATYRIPGVNKDLVDPIVFPDRVLILSQTGNFFLRPTVLWR